MKATDRERFAKALYSAGELHGRNLSTDMVDLYWDLLEEYPIDDVVNAIAKHLRDPDTGQYFPKPADIIRGISGNTTTQAAQAWTKMITAAARIGTYQSVVFDDWIIHAVVRDMGGWQAMGLITEDELPFREKDFCQRYRGYIGRKAAYPPQLGGREVQHNQAHGYQIENPSLVFVGDREQALVVYSGGTEGGLLKLSHGLRPVFGLLPTDQH